MIDIVIPTMWKADGILDNLIGYVNCTAVNKVIIIDNNKKERPVSDIFKHPKIELVCYNKNIYVNPAWNEGYLRSTSDIICFLNDDITVQDDIFKIVDNTPFDNIDIIGVNLKSGKDNDTIGKRLDLDGTDQIVKLAVDKSKPIGGQAWAFGICMFIKRSSYKLIPSLYQIWYGDDYLVQNNENIYVLMTNKITGVISKTISESIKQHDIVMRINLDSRNAYKFNHFQNGKNWDIFNKRFSVEENLLQQEYNKARATPSDINQNLHILYNLAKECSHITEMGVRTGVSTRAFLNTDANLISYDIVLNPEVEKLFQYAKNKNKQVEYVKADVLTIEIRPTDLLFIDTFHVYDQLKQELKLHANKVNKYIAFHDTYTFGLTGEDSRDKNGLLTAIIEFLSENKDWQIKFHTNKNNGLTILERK